ncbi:penicillin-binding protein [Lonsdalea populi]|uniref:Penicillin-binding protein activator LpoA n=1 Tax=Lonsdalea populi TaxID=1172565 RepID=A0A3N0UH75_9GAMM|nr:MULTISPECIES: penicillin-binding protein activator [Lonsdalea]RAT16629.1 penicillin-binding protein [Lonsdalea quercina]RAT29754.1 penicillin-binding protein [Lonsdalea populi]RAT35484.1 penicillin-binding protein [Lonsdalea populi]RAT48574.1 penicillin-binding protein [Lonsdalea populi]RAT55089.1 penicillin-binding protein [Lonsdalea populi]
MLPLNYVRARIGRVIPVVLAALFLAGCPSQAPQNPSNQQVAVKAGAASDYYLQQMQQGGDDNKADWQLLAIHALIQEGKLPQALAQWSALPASLNGRQQLEQRLLNAELAVARNDMNAANGALSPLDVNALSGQQQERYYQALISANQAQPSLTLLRAYIAQEPQLQSDARQRNIDLTWSALTRLSPQTINSIAINADENTLAGWLDLLTTYQSKTAAPAELKTAIADWQARYPRHPAAKTLPTVLMQQGTGPNLSTSGNIALLLPLNGQAQVYSKAIQAGFSAARDGQAMPNASVQMPEVAPITTTPEDSTPAATANQALAAPTQEQPASVTAAPAPYSTAATPDPTSSRVAVKVYDTTGQQLANVIAQAQKDGATMIVGPLLKNDVEQLPAAQTTLPVLALNQPEHVQPSPNICYFALSPEDEARDAAQFIHSQGKQQPLVLAPRGSLGDRVTAAFAAAWQQQGGAAPLQQRIGSTAELKQAINNGAGISLSGQPIVAEPTSPQPQSSTTIGGLNIPAQVPPTPAETSAGGVDAVYIIATPDELSLIKPMIDLRNKSRARAALYASSRSNQAGFGPDFRLEMEGLQFSDIPLLTGANPSLMQQTTAQFRNDYSLVRLFAMGMDAWTLANNFSSLRQPPGYRLEGSTGQLSATPDCVVNRKLTWLQFRQGQLVPAS